MSAPALDGVLSRRVGFIHKPNASLLCELHDNESTTMDGMSEPYCRPTGMNAHTHAGHGMVVEQFIRTAGTEHLVNFSDEFIDRLSTVYEHVTGEEDEETTLDYTGVTDLEEPYLQSIVQQVNEDNLPIELWTSVVKRAHRTQIPEFPGFDFSDDQFNAFNTGNYTDQADMYLPRSCEIDNWHFHLQEHRSANEDGSDSLLASLWFQYKTVDGYRRERPVVFYTDGYWVPYSHDVEFGDNEYSDNLSEQFNDALHRIVTGDGQHLDDLTIGEAQIIAALHKTDGLEGTLTYEYIEQL